MSEPEKGKFFKENNKIYYIVKSGDNLTRIAEAYINTSHIPKTSTNLLIEMIVEVNKKNYSIKKEYVQKEWKLEMPSYNEVTTRTKETHKMYFNGKTLEWRDSKNSVLLSVGAVSGLRKNNPRIKTLIERGRSDIKTGVDYTDPKYQNVLDVGPIPKGTYYIELRKDVPRDQTGGGYGWGGWILKPSSSILKAVGWLESGKKKIDVPFFRSGFYLHHDYGNDGTSGCVGISRESDTIKVWGLLKEYQMRGHSKIDLIIQY